MKLDASSPKNAGRAADARRSPSGSWRTPGREATGSHPIERARQQTGSFTRPQTGSHRRTSSLPRRLLLGRLVRGSVLVGLAGLAAVGVIQVASWVEHGNALPVRTVAVRSLSASNASNASNAVGASNALAASTSSTNAAGASDVSKERADEILAYANVKKGEPLFAVDVDAVAKRVLEHPFVASATVRRVPPDGIEIAVTQRAPVAALSTAGALYLVDDKGAVMKAARTGDGLDLAVITGVNGDEVASGAASASIAQAVALLAAHKAAGAPGGNASEVHVVDGVGFELVLDDGTRVVVGNEADAASAPGAPNAATNAALTFGAKMLRLDAIERGLKASNRSAQLIVLNDDRRPERAAVRLRPIAEMPSAGGKKKTSRERG